MGIGLCARFIVLKDESTYSSLLVPLVLSLLSLLPGLPLPIFPSAPGRQILSADIPGSGAMQGISLSDLTGMPHHEQKQLLGERLFRSVISIDPQFHDMDLAGKITGMLLEMDNADILHLLESQDALREKVQEAIAVLEAHEQLESTTSELSAAAMAPPSKTVKYSSVVRSHPSLQGKQSNVHLICSN